MKTVMDCHDQQHKTIQFFRCDNFILTYLLEQIKLKRPILDDGLFKWDL